MAEPATAALAKLDARLAGLDPESLRARVIVALRQFRAGWVALGRMLTDVAYGGDYKEWGYDDFEVYCARELGLKKPTVQKLMISYNYLKKYEAARLETAEDGGEEPPPAPDYQTVALLDSVRRGGGVDAEEVEQFHARAFAGDDDETALRRELRSALRPVADPAAAANAADGRRRAMAGVLRLARALRRELAAAGVVPGGLRERLEAALVELEALD